MKVITSLEELTSAVKVDGLYDVPDELYFSSGIGISHSDLKQIFPPNTPQDFKRMLGRVSPKSKALDFGSAVHLAIFQHDIFDDNVVVEPSINKRTNVGKAEYAEFIKQSEGKLVISQEELEACYRIMENVERHPIIGRVFQGKVGRPETAGYFKRNGHQYRFKMDYIIEDGDFILELKTTISGHEWSFKKSIQDYNYYTQMAMYRYGYQQIKRTQDIPSFGWIVVEKSPPFKVYLWEPSENWFKLGIKKLTDAMDLYEYCVSKDEWKGIPDEFITIEPPRYLMKGDEFND